MPSARVSPTVALAAAVLLITAVAAIPHGNALAASIGPVTGAMTAAEFAVQCQHPGQKSNPKERLRVCVEFIDAAIQAVGLANRHESCLKDLAERADPASLMEVVFYVAMQPAERRRSITAVVREAVLLAAKSCR